LKIGTEFWPAFLLSRFPFPVIQDKLNKMISPEENQLFITKKKPYSQNFQKNPKA